MEELSQVKQALRKNPDDARMLRAAGLCHLREEEYKRARDYYIQAAAFFPRYFPGIILEYETEIARAPRKIGTRLSLASFLLAHGETDACILELEEALLADPKNVEVYNVLGRIYIKQERIDEVIELLERSVALGVKDVVLTEILAGAYLEKGRIREAIKFYEELLSFRPGEKRILRVLGELYTRIEGYNRAADFFRAMFSEDPEFSREVIQRLEGLLKIVEGNVYIRELLADIYMRSIKPAEAVKMLSEVLKLDPVKIQDVILKLRNILKNYPDHPEASLALADALRMKGDFSESVETCYRLVKSRPEHLKDAMRGYRKVLELCPDQILARNYLAEAYLYNRQIEEALREFESILRFDASAAESTIARCRGILKSNPNMLLARLVMGRAYMVKQDYQRAAMEAEGIVAADKNFTPAYLLLGEVYFKLKLCRKAVGVLRTALNMDPYNIFIQEQYRNAMERELEMEIESVKERINEDQWKLSLHLDLAKLYTKKGLKEEAIRELQTAVKDQARASFAFDQLGRIYRKEGRFDLAAGQFERAREALSDEMADLGRVVRFNLGTTHEGRGNIQDALRIYEEILQEDIDFGGLSRRIEYLKASSLHSLRDKALLAVISDPSRGEIIALWGREGRPSHSGRRELMSVSFGQNYNTSGFEYFMKGMNKAAIEEFTLAVQLDANFSTALNNLGVTLMREGKLAEAKLRLENAVHLNPGSVVMRNNLGVVYLLLRDIERARLELSAAAELDPDLSAVCINHGDLCYYKKEVEKAIRSYLKVGKYDVLSEIAEQRLLYRVP